MTVKLSLVAAFLMTMATLTFAASALPTVEAGEIAPKATVVYSGVFNTAGSQVRQVAMPAGVVPAAATELMASL
jgi:hypothetical protein